MGIGEAEVLRGWAFFSWLTLSFLYCSGQSPDEYYSLKTIYESTDGENWKHHWDLSDSNYCNWAGLTCKHMVGADDLLSEMDLSNFGLGGSLPADVFSNFSAVVMEKIDLSYNAIRGKIPPSIGDMVHLRHLTFFSNQLTGEVPSSIGRLTFLYDMYLDYNNLEGTIPATIAAMKNLDHLYMPHNLFTGSIPVEIGTIRTLVAIDLSHNRLNGTIPSSIKNLGRLNYLYLNYNQLSGSIPHEIDQTPLVQLHMFNNLLSGKIPTSIGNISSIEEIDLANNLLSGTIPGTIRGSSTPELHLLSLGNNSLNGPLSPDLFTILTMKYLVVNTNSLTGTIPTAIGNVSHLIVLFLGENDFTGTLPVTIGELRNLQEFSVNMNHFTGTLPSSVSHLRGLKTLTLSQNGFVGRLPFSMFSGLHLLRNFSVGSNMFTGPVPVLNSSILENFDISNNRFTGRIPDSYFQHPLDKRLASFSASVNCISAELPASICSSSSLKELLISGLHQQGICDPTGPQYLIDLPSCIWELPSLQRLYLAGNGYSGELGKGGLWNVTELSISHNRIYGILPPSFGNGRTIEVFDVSNNLITGFVDVPLLPASDSSTLAMDTNRFSGSVDVDSISHFKNPVNVLLGNLFSCQTNIHNDENHSIYTCGSENLDFSMIYWCCWCFVAVVLFLVCAYAKLDRTHKIVQWTRNKLFNSDILGTDRGKEVMPVTCVLLSSLSRLLRLAPIVVLPTVILGLVLYPLLKVNDDYRTHKIQYSYDISGVYMKTAVPAASVLVCFAFSVAIILSVFLRIFEHGKATSRLAHLQNQRPDAENSPQISRVYALICALRPMGCVLLFLATATLVNVGYVFQRAKVQGIGLILLQAGLLIFNASSRIAVPALVRFIFQLPTQNQSSPQSVMFMAFIVTSLDVIVPFIATLVADDLCIHEVVSGVPSIPVDLIYSTSVKYGNGGDWRAFSSFSTTVYFTPPFVYSGQCRNAILTYFVPVVISSSAFQAFAIPIIYFLFTYDLRYLHMKMFHFFEAREFVLYDSMYSLILIWEEFLMLLTYGIISPVAATAIGFNICSQIVLLCCAIRLYTNLQFVASESASTTNDTSTITTDSEFHIESICERTYSNSCHMIWPGLIISISLFSLYLFDMACDVQGTLVLAAPLCVLIATLAVIPFALVVYSVITARFRATTIELQIEVGGGGMMKNPLIK